MTEKLLALDTSTEACSAALMLGETIISDFIVSQREHTQKLLPMIDKLLAEAGISLNQLDAIAFGRGPGSFTGVRIGIGVAQGLALGADKPLIAVSTLMTLAQGAWRQNRARHVMAAIDARMHEVYFAQYWLDEQQHWQTCSGEQVLKPADVMQVVVPTPDDTVFAAGTGWQTYPDMLAAVQTTEVLLPQAQDMLPIAQQMWHQQQWLKVEEVEPTYLRNEVTWQKLPGRQ